MGEVLLQLFVSFLKVGAFAFGGGYAMIPLISEEVVTYRGWLEMEEFIDVIAISQGTPGPIAINSATFVGFKVAGVIGSITATLGVVLPSFVIMMVLGRLFLRYKEVPVVKHMLSGIRPVVVALILAAAFSVLPNSITGIVPAIVAAVVIIAIVVFDVDPILLLVLSGVMGFFAYR
ncbi:MAG TPA: chromate transporter [Bacillota bacterium]|nr:chromate transporter [Candidatus Fermentithermobacillaceae bacterium]HOB29838.1 chromate transporter [Bacillota bacterium]HOK65109.1 chromate transporter [Bacillota bacterium]HOQ02660.1 chromate transporter [Bacillota bacterium]HPV13943.1 chromate transporter [Bacillota bacterium]